MTRKRFDALYARYRKTGDSKLASALKPYKVDNAVILAAGMSSRFAPLSYEKPKGLLTVKGEVLIERQIRQLQEVGITDIFVVVGCMKQQFYYLEEKFGVRLVVNEDFYRYNNSSSMLRVADRLANTYICYSDHYFSENVFESHVYDSYYSAVFIPGSAPDERGIRADRSGRIIGIKHGPVDGWCMMGQVYFSRAFSRKFAALLKANFDKADVRQSRWEYLYEKNLKTLKMSVRRYPEGIIHELDAFEELRNFDAHYLDNAGSRIFQNICRVLKCREHDIDGIVVIKQGLTNLSFKFTCHGKAYIYRHPGEGTETLVSRRSEAFSLGVAKRLGLDPTLIYIDSKTGWRVSHFIENARNLDYHNWDDVATAMKMMRKLHASKAKSPFSYDILRETQRLIRLIPSSHKDFEDFRTLEAKMARIRRYVRGLKRPKVLCHCDCYPLNYLVGKDGRTALIDWEYSGMSDPGVDLGAFICNSDYTFDESVKVLRMYHGRALSEAELRPDFALIALSAWHWIVWSIFQESRGKTVGDYTIALYRHVKLFAAKVLS